ncbi:MFS family permease [Streptomyces sp. SAI-170]|uniref:MFS transporter n=1 Tax=Streptomyces sp. SAI-170 TaxID=3377729 RepID=UPI003C7B7176
MATMDAASRGSTPSGFRKIIAGSMAGTIAEWYEFFIYGTAASLVFGDLFFPGSDNPLDGVIAAFGTYAIGFVARPIGGLVFGHYGDRYGRKRLLQISLLLVGVSTFLMGCLPGFDAWGYLAPIALVTLRFVQGFAVGGEWGGAVLLVSEHSPDHRRGTWAAFPQAAVPLGNLLATIVLLALNAAMSEQAFLAWGWRIAFWLSAVIIIVGYYVRKNLEDAPLFVEALERQKEREEEQAGLKELLSRHPKQVLAGMAARLGDNTLYYLIATFTITYLTVSKNMSTQTVLLLMFIGNAFQTCFMIVAGYLSDRIGRRRTYLLGGVIGLVWAVGYFFALETVNFWVILAAIVAGLGVHAMLYAPLGAMLSEMFPTRVRYTGASFCYQVTSIFAGSLAPIIAAVLLSHFDSTVPITIYIVVILAVSTTTIFAAYKETSGTSLRAIDEADLAARQETVMAGAAR